MKLIADLHTHTTASTHAFSTLRELVWQAQTLGMCAMAVTDHAPALPDSPPPPYFKNITSLPDILDDGFLLLKGAEVNVMDAGGALDLPERRLEKLDWVIASLHHRCIEPMDVDTTTSLWLAIAENPLVDMIGHSETQEYLYDYDRATKAFAAHNKVVELNAGSAFSRPGNEGNLRRLAQSCKQNGAYVAVNTDAPPLYARGHTEPVLKMLAAIDFPEELVVNSSKERLRETLRRHKKPIAQRIEGLW